MTVFGEHIVLRSVQPADFPAIITWNNDPTICDCHQDHCPQSLDDCESWYRSLQSDRHNQTFAMCTKDGTLIGDIELDHIAWRSGEAELRVRVADELHRGKGLGSDAIKALLNHSFTTLNLKRVYLRVLDTNRAAIRCYQKCGFRKEGRLQRSRPDGTTMGIILMTIMKDDFLGSEHAQGA